MPSKRPFAGVSSRNGSPEPRLRGRKTGFRTAAARSWGPDRRTRPEDWRLGDPAVLRRFLGCFLDNAEARTQPYGSGVRCRREKLTGQCPVITARVSAAGSSPTGPCSAESVPAVLGWSAGYGMGFGVIPGIVRFLVFSSGAGLLLSHARPGSGTRYAGVPSFIPNFTLQPSAQFPLFIQRTLS